MHCRGEKVACEFVGMCIYFTKTQNERTILMDKKEGELEISLSDVLSVILRRWWIILIAIILCSVLVFVYLSVTYVPTYKSTAKMYVNNDSSTINSSLVNISSSDILASQALVNTYCVILKSRVTLDEVIRRSQLDYTYEQLLSMIDCGSVNDTEVLYISVTSTDPAEARAISNGIAKVLSEQITSIIKGSSVKTVDEAVDGQLVASRKLQKVLIVALIAFVAAFGFFFVYDVIINDTLKDEDWLLDTYNSDIPLLAVIPDTNGEHTSKGGYGYGYYRGSAQG